MAEVQEPMSDDLDASSDRYRRKFNIAYREIGYLKGKVHLQTGWFFIKSHKFTQQELLESEHCVKIKANMRKVGDDVNLWHKTGRLLPSEKVFYRNHRDELDERFGDLIHEIETRPPTWWENVKGAFVQFVHYVMESLPVLDGFLALAAETVGRIKFFGPVFGTLSVFAGRGIRLIGEQARAR